jgi:HEAT repeat protein
MGEDASPRYSNPRELAEAFLSHLTAIGGGAEGSGRDAWLAGRRAAEALADLGEPGIDALCAVFAAPDVPSNASLHAAHGLGYSGHPRAVAVLIAALDGTYGPFRRLRATCSLYVAGPMAVAAILPLVALLVEEEVTLAYHVVDTLAHIGPPAVPALLVALDTPPVRRRAQAATALGLIGDPRTLGPLMAACSDRWVSMRRAAATALGTLGRPRATPALLPLLQDASALVRGSAIEALGKIAGPEVLPTLEAARDHDTARIRGWEPIPAIATRAIARIQARTGRTK